jgi:serine/threonine protein kinase
MLEAKGGKGPPLPQALRYGVQVTWGLASLHDQNVAVLDLKPDNLLFDEHDLHYSPLSRNQAGV